MRFVIILHLPYNISQCISILLATLTINISNLNQSFLGKEKDQKFKLRVSIKLILLRKMQRRKETNKQNTEHILLTTSQLKTTLVQST